MRLIFFCLLIFYGVILPAAAQELVISDSLNGKERIFTVGKSFLYMTTQNPEYTKGKLVNVYDTSLVLYLIEEEAPVEKVISVKDIIVIRKASKSQYISYVIGGLFLLNGAYFTIEGPSLRERGIGVLSFAAGLIPFFFTPKTYDIGSRYRLATRNPAPAPPENKEDSDPIINESPEKQAPDEIDRIYEEK